jgi:hypothetical protein
MAGFSQFNIIAYIIARYIPTRLPATHFYE